MAKKYALTPAHRAQLEPWAEQWIANAMSTAPMDDAERTRVRGAVRGLYEAAGLTPPPDHRIVFVPSPFVARFAAGFAAAIWWLRANKPATADATADATRAATWDATRDATRAATAAATRAATADATRDATEAATEAATRAATRAATEAATRAATWDATEAATRAATEAATRAATEAATRAATAAATWDATEVDEWYNFPVMAMRELADRLLGSGHALFGLQCATNVIQMWNGGNQSSPWVSYLSFFRHVARLPLDYTKWDHYEEAARAGPRLMHPEFCIISERPAHLTVDADRRSHAEDGPFCRWRDGSALYAWHGVRVPMWVIEHPERITAETIAAEPNQEIRRAMIERIGWVRYLDLAGAQELQRDDTGILLRLDPLPGDTDPLLVVRVTNSTPEPDGSFKDYVLRVHPECRPILGPDTFGEPQALTAMNAVASTFGLRGSEYLLAAES